MIQSTSNMPECLTMQELQKATCQDQHLQYLMEYVTQGWPESKNQLPQDIRTYWMFRDDMAVIDWVVIKGRCIIILEALQQQVLKQLHINHMGIKKTKFLVCKSVYWIGMNADIENHIKIVLHALIFWQTQPKEKFIRHDIAGKPWEVMGVDMSISNNKNYLCIVDYHSRFLRVKKAEDMSADSLILPCKVIFSEFGLLKKIMSDVGGNIISDKFKQFCKNMNIEQATPSLYHCQSNGHIEACIKFIKHTMKKCTETNKDIHITLLQIKSTPLEPGLPSPATLLFNCPI